MSSTASSLPSRSTGVTGALAQYVSALKYAELDERTCRVARHCLLDWVAVAIGGADDQTTRILRTVAEQAGGEPQASIVRGTRSSALQAALVNGTAGHALDFDDVHYAMPGHPSAAVAPAVMALAERDGMSGEEIIVAFVAGVEVACRAGRYVTGQHYDKGWHATATLGTFGAAAACARLLRLDATRTAIALGIAGTQAAGLKSMFGTMCKPMHAGKAASNGLFSALLAAEGFSAAQDVLECTQGFGDTQSQAVDAHAALDGLGQSPLISDVLFKYHAACYGTHASIEAARSLIEAQKIDTRQIAKVEVRVKPRYMKICNIDSPTTGLEAKFSLRMTSAMALSGVPTSNPAQYSASLCERPDLKALAERTIVVPAEELGDGASEVIVSLDDGVVYRLRGDVSKPWQDLDAQGNRLREKFDSLVLPVLGEINARELAEMLESLHDQGDVRALMALTRA